jgi:peptidyl-tRNA hydrolase, PTH2 family
MPENHLEVKQVIAVRKDIAMGRGKLAAQVAHAAVFAAENARSQRHNWFNIWFRTGQAKVVVKAENLEELIKLENHARTIGLPAVSVQDSGLTQIPPGTITCIGIGPGPAELIDKVTRHLKLL